MNRQSGTKVVDQFAKLGKIGFSMEFFTADFLQLFTNHLLVRQLVHSLSGDNNLVPLYLW